MAVKVMVKNIDEIESYAFDSHKEKSIVISIYSYGKQKAFINASKINNILDILFMQFNDTDDRSIESGGMTEDQAYKIYEFIYKHRNDDIDAIIFQCEEGYSRSAGCASALERVLFSSSDILESPDYDINILCYNLVYAEFCDNKSLLMNYLESAEVREQKRIAEQLKNGTSEGYVEYEEIVADISQGIQNKTLKAGQSLPSVRELANAMNRSLYTVSLAYRLLENEGLIKKISNGVYIVSGNTKAAYNDEQYKEIEKQLLDIVALSKKANVSFRDLVSMINILYGEVDE